MDQAAKKGILDLSFPNQNQAYHSNIAWNDSIMIYPNLKVQDQNSGKLQHPVIKSSEEMKIRGELEMDIERNLEEEIKDGIYHLALKLHRLYQQQKERNAKEVSESATRNQPDRESKTLSEVNISIRMEGGTKIEIREIKKQAPEKGPQWTSRSESAQASILATDAKKFDWAKSLRAGRGPVINNKRSERCYQAKALTMNLNPNNARRNLVSATGERKTNIGVDNKLLELGWKC